MQRLHTCRLALEPYAPTQRVEFLDWMAEDSVEAFLSRSFPGSPRGSALFEAFATLRADANHRHLAWAVKELASGRLVGHVECKATVKVLDGQLELIYAVRHELRSNGFATESTTQVSGTLAAAGIEVVAFINPKNVASRRVLQKSKFRLLSPTSNSSAEQWLHPAAQAPDSDA